MTAVAAGCNPFGRSRDLRNGFQNGTQEEVAAKHDKQDKRQTKQHRKGDHSQNLPVCIAQTGDIAHHTDYFIIAVDQRRGNRQNPLPGPGIFSGKDRRFPALHGIHNFRSSGHGAGPLRIGGGDQVSRCIHKLKFNGIFVLKILRKGDAGVVKLMVTLRDIALEKAVGCFGFCFHAGAQRRIVIRRDDHREDDHAGNDNRKNHADRIGIPSSSQAAAASVKNSLQRKVKVFPLIRHAPHL